MNGHPAETVLSQAAYAGLESVDPEVASHLEACPDCRAEVEDYREILGALKDSASSAMVDAEELVSGAGIDEILEFEKRLEAEDARAREALEARTLDEARAALETGELDATAGLVRELVARSEAAREQKPKDALGLVLLAREVAAKLAPEAYPRDTVAHLRGSAEKEYSNALRVIGRYLDALAALDRAEEYFGEGFGGDYDLAVVKYGRSLCLAATDRREEALGLAIASAEVLEEYGDVVRAAHSRMLEVDLRMGRGEVARAREILDGLLEPLEKADEPKTLSALLANRGIVAVEEGDFQAAQRWFDRAGEINHRLGLFKRIAYTDWQVGALLVQAGRTDEGISLFERARVAFTDQGMPGEVAALSLELVDALLAIDRHDRAREICAGLPEECKRLGMPRNVLLALAYLKECGERNALTREAAAFVGAFLKQAKGTPAQVFQAPLA